MTGLGIPGFAVPANDASAWFAIPQVGPPRRHWQLICRVSQRTSCETHGRGPNAGTLATNPRLSPRTHTLRAFRWRCWAARFSPPHRTQVGLGMLSTTGHCDQSRLLAMILYSSFTLSRRDSVRGVPWSNKTNIRAAAPALPCCAPRIGEQLEPAPASRRTPRSVHRRSCPEGFRTPSKPASASREIPMRRCACRGRSRRRGIVTSRGSLLA